MTFEEFFAMCRAFTRANWHDEELAEVWLRMKSGGEQRLRLPDRRDKDTTLREERQWAIELLEETQRRYSLRAMVVALGERGHDVSQSTLHRALERLIDLQIIDHDARPKGGGYGLRE